MQSNLALQELPCADITAARMLEFTIEGVYPAELLSRRISFNTKLVAQLNQWLTAHGWLTIPFSFGMAPGWQYMPGDVKLPSAGLPILVLREAVLSNAAHLVEEHLASIGYHVVRSRIGCTWHNRSYAVLAPGEFTKSKRRPKRGKHWMSLRAAARRAGLFPANYKFDWGVTQ